jgi:hypothetical protein
VNGNRPAHTGPQAGIEIEICPEWDPSNQARIRIPWAASFDDLAEGILVDVLDWDIDHLYEFCIVRDGTTFRQKIKRSLKVLGPDLEAWQVDESYSEQPLEDLSEFLVPRKRFYFHFDFGDDHWFRLVVKRACAASAFEVLSPLPTPIVQYQDQED